MNTPRNAAYTQPVTILTYYEGALHVLIKPGTDTDSAFIAWHEDSQDFIRVDGWMVEIEEGHI